MTDKRRVSELSLDELEQVLHERKHRRRRERLERLRDAGRLLDAAEPSPPRQPPPVAAAPAEAAGQVSVWRQRGKRLADRALVLVEVGAFLAFIFLVVSFLDTRQELNQELAELQSAQSQELVLPTPSPTPIIGVVVLPSGHKPPVEGRAPEPGEVGNIPAHLMPIINAYRPPPIPTPSPEQARRIQIPALDVDKPIVQGDDWEQLKKGVGQHIGSALPGRTGNVVLSAHNDIYGEIFRHLDKLTRGDEIIISTERRAYRYVVTGIEVVEPTAVEVMAPTEHASATLISCYPYLVNDKRIVVFADLAETTDNEG
jgi:sortase A